MPAVGLTLASLQQCTVVVTNDTGCPSDALSMLPTALLREPCQTVTASWPGVLQASGCATSDVPACARGVRGWPAPAMLCVAPAQDMFLQSHGIGAPTQTTAQLLVSYPLLHPGREAVFRALTAVPHLGPQAAHAIVGSFASLGPLMAAYTEPSRSGCMLNSSHAPNPNILAEHALRCCEVWLAGLRKCMISSCRHM